MSGHLWKDELPPAQRRALENLVKYGDMAYGFKTRSEHGGLTSTRAALVRKGFIDVHTYEITEAGRAALQGNANPTVVARERAAAIADAFSESAAKRATAAPEGSFKRRIFFSRAKIASKIASAIRADTDLVVITADDDTTQA